MTLRSKVLACSVGSALLGLAVWLVADKQWAIAFLVAGVIGIGVGLPLRAHEPSDHPHDSGGSGQMGGSIFGG